MRREAFMCIILVVAVIATASLMTMALQLKYIFEVNVRGTVNVKSNVTVIDVDIDIDDRRGEKIVNLGNVYIPRGNTIVKADLISYEGNFTLLLSGVLQLDSTMHSYRIAMPCLVAIGEPCYRILMVIPGYDVPLTTEEGVYNVTFIMQWHASGTGRFHLKLLLEHSETFNDSSVLGAEIIPYIRVIGIKPEHTDGWTVAQNSTRSYSMLVGRVSPTVAWVWIWIFDTSNTSGRIVTVTLSVIDELSRSVVMERTIDMFRDGMYWSVLLEIKIPTGGRYKLVCTFENVVMSATMESGS